MYLVIERRGKASEERAVKIVQWRQDHGPMRTMLGSWVIDPCKEIRALVNRMPRRFCVNNFAAGLQDARHTVYMDIQFDGENYNGMRLFRFNQAMAPIYWLFGFAWGLGQWEALVRTLYIHVPFGSRVAALEATAQYYRVHCFDRELRLHLPQ